MPPNQVSLGDDVGPATNRFAESGGCPCIDLALGGIFFGRLWGGGLSRSGGLSFNFKLFCFKVLGLGSVASNLTSLSRHADSVDACR